MAELFGRIFGNPKPDRDEIDTSGLEDDTEVEFDTEEEEGEGLGADEFGDYDDEAKTHIETVINKRLQAQRDQDFATMRLNAQARGLDFTADGQILPADYQKIQGWLPQQAAPAPAFQPQQQAAAPVEEQAMPDPTLYPEEFMRWNDARLEKKVAERLQAQEQSVASTRGAMMQFAAGNATQRVAAKLNELGYGQLAQHPQFVQKFQEALPSIPIEQWNDDTNLARLAFVLIPDLPMEQTPAPRQKVAPNPSSVADSYASRAGAPSFAPAREVGGQQQGRGASAEEAMLARTLGIPVDEWRALQDPSGDKYTAYKARKNKDKVRR